MVHPHADANREAQRRQRLQRTTQLGMLTLSLLVVSGCAAPGEDSARPDGPAENAGATADGGLPGSAGIGSALRGVRPEGRDVAVNDSGPNVRVEHTADSLRLVMDAAAGDQINALQPPVLELRDGSRLTFVGGALTPDSAYFVGDVELMLPRQVAPAKATLHTSYCRAGERLCRSVSREVLLPERAGD